MNDSMRRRVQSLTRHITTAGGGGTVGIGFDPSAAAGPVFLGLAMSQWIGLVVMLAGAVNAWVNADAQQAPSA